MQHNHTVWENEFAVMKLNAGPLQTMLQHGVYPRLVMQFMQCNNNKACQAGLRMSTTSGSSLHYEVQSAAVNLVSRNTTHTLRTASWPHLTLTTSFSGGALRYRRTRQHQRQMCISWQGGWTAIAMYRRRRALHLRHRQDDVAPSSLHRCCVERQTTRTSPRSPLRYITMTQKPMLFRSTTSTATVKLTCWSMMVCPSNKMSVRHPVSMLRTAVTTLAMTSWTRNVDQSCLPTPSAILLPLPGHQQSTWPLMDETIFKGLYRDEHQKNIKFALLWCWK